ncbi:MAG: MBL fold metallo-hydrolase [Thermanaerothrix sp.]|jgi:L-ascorbate metabolism protein UlaG (beta-lactamase superfamily)|uniref:MBL fold metallo-hydrolase n=1 Tax=Thermanaerothrix solaris TaxID=3058434 RepID=A0ABU3NRT2_9CHLR|nr:MBL fold metallo-hydrolase [Thermanaerothrix sp. 4228-RoL]MDT8898787.1 MBL fold metallo-hydrolase [Thermanaerothrix sp. 4228-RoL]
MEITWYGHSCFRITERNLATVVTDPYDHRAVGYAPLKLKADIVTVSHAAPGHNYLAGVKGEPYVITGPGEYEIGGVFITGLQTNGTGKKSTDEPRNTLYLIEYNGINVLHLGNLNRVPTQAEVESLGAVHIVLVPVGGGSTLNAAKAAEVVSLLEPNIVIPMHYATPDSAVKLDGLNKFLKAMGLNEVTPQPVLKVNSVNALPEETQVIVLEYQHH